VSITRRHLQVGLGLLWLLDGALQLQPFMFTTAFSRDVLAPAGDGQPGWVAVPVHFFANQFAQHPVVFNGASAIAQLTLGFGFLLPRTVRPAIVASIGWSLAVWWVGEGFGGLASGHASIVTGAPGAAVLYGVLAAATWPRGPAKRSIHRDTVSSWLRLVWTAVWLGAAALQALSAQNEPRVLADQLRASAADAPAWLRSIDHVAADAIARAGTGGQALAVIVLAAVGIGVLIPGRARAIAALAGAGLAVLFWFVGQNLGELYAGDATDPNTGLLLVLFAAAVAGIVPDLAPRPAIAGGARLQTPRPMAHSGRLIQFAREETAR
jgi:hypothetical protein